MPISSSPSSSSRRERASIVGILSVLILFLAFPVLSLADFPSNTRSGSGNVVGKRSVTKPAPVVKKKSTTPVIKRRPTATKKKTTTKKPILPVQPEEPIVDDTDELGLDDSEIGGGANIADLDNTLDVETGDLPALTDKPQDPSDQDVTVSGSANALVTENQPSIVAKQELEIRQLEEEPVGSEKLKAAIPADVHKIEPARASLDPRLMNVLQSNIGELKIVDGGELFYIADEKGRKQQLTFDATLQRQAEGILSRYRVPWGSVVAMNPRTGKVLALAEYSQREPSSKRSISTRATFPAASLFKLITSAAGIEKAGVPANQIIRYHGSDYALGKRNYQPNAKLDRRMLTFADALGKSCNPVFARLALNYRLNQDVLRKYAEQFGFNRKIPFDAELEMSSFSVGGDDYSLARTAAGFGDVFLSPLHAALITSAIANKGQMVRPYMVRPAAPQLPVPSDVAIPSSLEPVVAPTVVGTAIERATADKLLDMMKATVDNGTARRAFARLKRSMLREVEVAGKTGTLSGVDPKGRYHWFVAAAPVSSPEIVLSVLIIDPGGARVKSTSVGSYLLENYFARKTASSTKKAKSTPAVG